MNEFYAFEKFPPSSGDVDFCKVFAVDVLEKETRELCENATKSRKEVTASLKLNDAKLTAKATQAYFEQGWSLLRSIEETNSAYRIPMNKTLKFRWKSSLAEIGKRQYEGSVLIFDLIQVLVTRGIAYTNFAASLITRDQYKPAGTALRVAAGIFDAAANTLIPRWNNLKISELPPECNKMLCSALKEFTMAQAQQATILMAIETGKTKMLPMLLLGLADRFERVSKSVSKVSGVDSAFVSYVKNMPFMMRALAHEKIALPCWDQGTYGKAIKLLSTAKTLLKSCDDRGANWVEMNTRIENTLVGWNKENNTIFFDVPPDSVDLPRAIEMLKPIPFTLPKPTIQSFKPIEVKKKEEVAVPTPPLDDTTTTTTTTSKVDEEEEKKDEKEEEEEEEEKKKEKDKEEKKEDEDTTTTTKPIDNLYNHDFTDADFMSNLPTTSVSKPTPSPSISFRWQFEDGRAGSGKWKDYNRDDARQLNVAMQSGNNNVMIRNRFGTYDITLPSRPDQMGTQRNRRSGARRRVRCLSEQNQRRQDEDRTRVSVVAPPSAPRIRDDHRRSSPRQQYHQDDNTVLIDVSVGRGMFPGQTVRISYAGMPFDVKVPVGAYPGSTFQVRVPKPKPSSSRSQPRQQSSYPGLEMLIGMGFDRQSAIRALESSNGDVQQAAIMLSSS